MGMPITGYKVLQLLANRSAARGEDEQRLWDVLAEFRLLAVVLHDPSRHANLHNVVSSGFERLDRVTGPHLLFFAAVEASPKWRADSERRSYFSLIEERLHIGYAHAMPTPTIDPELSVVGAALALGIPASALPCVAVFQGRSSEFCWFETDASAIERQLERLALAAYSLAQAADALPPGDLQRHLSDYGIQQRSSSVGSGASVAGSLATVLAASAVDPVQRADARGDLRRAIEVQQRKLERIIEENRDGASDALLEIVRCALGLGISIALSRGGTGQLNWLWPPRELWEIEAAASLAAAMKLRTLNDPEVTAAIIMCYGRSFEAEINASVVQGLRQRTGVLLPAFYGLHQPKVTARVPVAIGGRTETIDLNAKRDDRWLPPGLGQSELVANELGASGLLESRDWNTLLQEWKVLRQHRNAAAHSSVLQPSSIADCHDALSRLHASGVLSGILALKARLRGQAEPLTLRERLDAQSNVSYKTRDPRSNQVPYRVLEFRDNGDFIAALHELQNGKNEGAASPENRHFLHDQLARLSPVAGGSLTGSMPGDEIRAWAASEPLPALRAAVIATRLALEFHGNSPWYKFEYNELRTELLLGVAGVPWREEEEEEGLLRCLADCETLVHCLLGALNDVASTAPEGHQKDRALAQYKRVCSIVFR